MPNLLAQAVSAISFGVSFFLLWLTFVALWLAIVTRLFRNKDGAHVFGLKNKSISKGLDAITKAGSDYFATRVGRLHGITFGTLVITTVALGFWTLIVYKPGSVSINPDRPTAPFTR